MFLRVPFGFPPPTPCTPGLIQAALQQPQQGQGEHLYLEGAQHGLLGPGSAFLHAEALFVVTEAVFLAKAGGKRFHDLSGREIQRRGDQAPGRSIAWHLSDQDMHGDLWSTDRPPAQPLFVPERAYPAIHPRPTGAPGGRPLEVMLRGRDPRAPLRPTTFLPGSGAYRLVQPRVHPQPCQDLNPPLSRTGVHTGLDHCCHRVSPVEYPKMGAVDSASAWRNNSPAQAVLV
jgi:hypothetical protein